MSSNCDRDARFSIKRLLCPRISLMSSRVEVKSLHEASNSCFHSIWVQSLFDQNVSDIRGTHAVVSVA